MKTTPLISVIITTYNRPDFLLRAVKSILNQHHINIEIVIIDDGSVPKSDQILGDLINDARIKYIYQQNAERSAARNNGLNHATGEYLSFLDDDDELLPEFMTTLLPLLLNNNQLDLVFCNCYEKVKDKNIEIFNDKIDIPFDQLIYHFIDGNFVPNMCFLYRMSALKSIRYDASMHYNEDYDFTMKILAGNNVSYINTPLAIYHKHDSNSNIKQNYEADNRLTALEVTFKLRTRFINNTTIRKYIDSAITRRYIKTVRILLDYDKLDQIQTLQSKMNELGIKNFDLTKFSFLLKILLWFKRLKLAKKQ